MSNAHTTSPSLRNKVNFRKGWPNPNVVEDVLKPAAGVQIQAGFIGRRNEATPDKWVLGISAITQDAFVFRGDAVDPSSGRPAHNDGYMQVDLSGVQGISFQNPIEFETVQFVGTPAKGDLLYSPVTGDNAGKLVVAQIAAGTVSVSGVVAIAKCLAPVFYIYDTPYILVAPLPQRIVTE